ncbi:hypothetical protein DFP72DRAFT_873400, partial [Ephemerocybe angulata]
MDVRSLRHLSRKNLALDANGQILAQEKQDEYKNELWSWRRKIDATKILLDALRGKAKVAERNMDMWATMTAPVRRIPLEVLTEIFTLACLGDVFHLFPDSEAKTPISTSHSLIHVCKYWRDIALQTPRIWNHFVVVHPPVFQHRSFRWEHLIGVYGKNLTHVDLRLLKDGFPEGALTLHESIFNYQHQYISLRLQAPISSYFPHRKKYGGPFLEELLVVCRPYQVNQPYTEWDLDFEAPVLKKLSIFYDLVLRASGLTFRWKQLTHLFLGACNLDAAELDNYKDFFPFLSGLVNVTYLGFGRVALGESWRNTVPEKVEVLLPKLRHLEIQDPSLFFLRRDLHNANGRDVLAHISAPALTTFDLTFSHTLEAIGNLAAARDRINSFLERTPLLSKIRVLVALPSWPHGLPPGGALEQCPILAFSGDSQRFEAWAGISDASFTRHGELCQHPFARWPADVCTTDYFFDRFLEREDPLFQRAEEEEDSDEGSEWSDEESGEDVDEEQPELGHGATGGGSPEGELGPEDKNRYDRKDVLDLIRGVFKMLGQNHGVAGWGEKGLFRVL